MNNKWLYVGGIVIVLLISFYFYRKYRIAPEIALANLQLTATDGSPAKIDFSGGAAIVTFGASWCGSCIRELDQLAAIRKTTLAGIQVIVISDEPMETIQRFRDLRHYEFTFLKLESKFKTIGIHSLPTTYLFNKEGELKKETVGYIHWEDASTVNHLLALIH
jgi:thiol-disulfide isomerase/thioredoxin